MGPPIELTSCLLPDVTVEWPNRLRSSNLWQLFVWKLQIRIFVFCRYLKLTDIKKHIDLIFMDFRLLSVFVFGLFIPFILVGLFSVELLLCGWCGGNTSLSARGHFVLPTATSTPTPPTGHIGLGGNPAPIRRGDKPACLPVL